MTTAPYLRASMLKGPDRGCNSELGALTGAAVVAWSP